MPLPQFSVELGQAMESQVFAPLHQWISNHTDAVVSCLLLLTAAAAAVAANVACACMGQRNPTSTSCHGCSGVLPCTNMQ